MAFCLGCGEDHPGEPERTATNIAWADQLQSELRETARGLYGEALAAQGVTLTLDEQFVRATLDPLFAIGAEAMMIVLARHGALKQAER